MRSEKFDMEMEDRAKCNLVTYLEEPDYTLHKIGLYRYRGRRKNQEFLTKINKFNLNPNVVYFALANFVNEDEIVWVVFPLFDLFLNVPHIETRYVGNWCHCNFFLFICNLKFCST